MTLIGTYKLYLYYDIESQDNTNLCLFRERADQSRAFIVGLSVYYQMELFIDREPYITLEREREREEIYTFICMLLYTQ